MNNPARLSLVQPDQQPTPDANVRSIANYIYIALTRAESQPFGQDLLRNDSPELKDLIEIWYWFNPTTLIHRIVFWGDYPSAGGSDPSDNPYFWIPPQLYLIVSWQPTSGMDHYAAVLSQHSRLASLRKQIYDRPFTTQFERNLRSDIRSSIPPNGPAESSDLSESSSDTEDWKMTLMLVAYCKRIPAVPIPKAADILEVEERTVRNRIQRKELEAIPRKGSLWVTKRSINKYIKNHIYPTATFDVWNEVRAIAQRQKGKGL